MGAGERARALWTARASDDDRRLSPSPAPPLEVVDESGGDADDLPVLEVDFPSSSVNFFAPTILFTVRGT